MDDCADLALGQHAGDADLRLAGSCVLLQESKEPAGKPPNTNTKPLPAGNAWQPASARARIADEAADVLIYLIQFADVYEIDLLAEAYAKIERRTGRTLSIDLRI